jgi:hypothetical protein
MPARNTGGRVAASMQGSCLCGGVRFEVTEPFVGVVHCHCASCKKLSGGGGTTSGLVATSAIHVLAGEELLRTFQPADGKAKTFCSACGSNVFGAGYPESEASAVRLTTLDAGLEQEPRAHIFVRSVASWETLPEDGLPRFDERPG